MSRKIVVFTVIALFVVLILADKYTINFKVYDAKSFFPIKGAKIEVKGVSSGITNDRGVFSISLETGDYEVTVEAEGYNPETRKVTVIIDSDEEFYLMPRVLKKRDFVKTYENIYAVLVGVSKTADRNIPVLKYADSDVDKVKKLLQSYIAIPGKNIFVLKSSPDHSKNEYKSTKSIFLGVLDKLVNEYKIGPDDLLIIYMSTHGDTIPDKDGDEPDGYDEVFAMADSQMSFMSTFLVDDEFVKKLKKIHAKKLLMFDACYIAGQKALVIHINAEKKKDDLEENSDVVITSSSPGAASYESDQLGSSLFVAAIEETFKNYEDIDENGDGIIDTDEFFAGLKGNLERISRKVMGFTQSPTMSSKDVLALFDSKQAVLYMSVEPAGAEISLDGGKWIRIKEAKEFKLSTGYHTLKIRKEGYQPLEKTVKLLPGMNVLKVSLVKSGGWIKGKVLDKSDGSPIVGAQVLIIGSNYKVETDENGEFEILLPSGVYNGIVVEKEGYDVFKQEDKIIVKAGQVERRVISMKKITPKVSSEKNSYITVSSNLYGAKVFLNDIYIGETPVEGYPVKPGDYELKIVSNSGEVVKRRLSILPNRSLAFFIEFKNTNNIGSGMEIGKSEALEKLNKVQIIFSTVPSGAQVTLMDDKGNKKVLGMTPLNVKIDEGWYSFELEKSGYEPVSVDEDYYLAGDTVRYEFLLKNIEAERLYKEALKKHGKERIELLYKAYNLDENNIDIAVELIKSAISYYEEDRKGKVVYPYREQAYRELQKLLVTYKENPKLHFYAGILYFNRFNLGKARSEWKAAIDLEPSLIEAYYYMYKSYKIDPFVMGDEKREKMRNWALKFISVVKYLKLEKSYEKQLEEIYKDFPDLGEWGK